ncbi:MAG: hypothetical protein WDW36_010089 [Sanguina aurantia]
MSTAAQLAPYLGAVTRITVQLRHHYPLGRRLSTSQHRPPPTGALAAAVLQCFTATCPLLTHLEVVDIHPEFDLTVLAASLAVDPGVRSGITSLTLRLPPDNFPRHWARDSFLALQAFSGLTRLDARGHRTPQAADWGPLFGTLRSLDLAAVASIAVVPGGTFTHLTNCHLHASVSCTSLACLLRSMPALQELRVVELSIYVRPGHSESTDAEHLPFLCAHPLAGLQQTAGEGAPPAMTNQLLLVTSTSAALAEVLANVPPLPAITSCAVHDNNPDRFCTHLGPEESGGVDIPRSVFLHHIPRVFPALEMLRLSQCNAQPPHGYEVLLGKCQRLRRLNMQTCCSFGRDAAQSLVAALPLLCDITVSSDRSSPMCTESECQQALRAVLAPRVDMREEWLAKLRPSYFESL